MYKKLFILFLFVSSLYAQSSIPKIFQGIDNSNDDFVKKIVLSKDKKQLLIITRESVDLLDAKNFRLLHSLDFSGSAWDGDFAENGIVLLTHHDFTYYSQDGKKIIYRIDRRDVGSFKAIDVPNQGHIVNMIKDNGTYEQAFGFNQRLNGLMQLNLRTKKIVSLPYEDQYNNKKYLYDIKDNILSISNSDHEYTYVNIETNKLLTLKDIKYTKINHHNILSSNNIIQDRYRSLPDLQKGCISSDMEQYAILDNGSVMVYKKNSTKPIFTLPSIVNPFQPQSCLLYDDTLVIASKGIQHYDIKRDAALFSSIEKAKKIEPIIGTCHDDAFAISLWDGISYGWDLHNGELLWYSKGPEVQRNHWEYASYMIRLNSQEKIADIQPFGQRNQKYEFRINLLNGTRVLKDGNRTSPSTKNWITCDAGTGEVWLGKEYRFTYKDLDFYVLSDGEWLVHDSKRGYFNASSIKALSYLHIDRKPLDAAWIKQYYRPDVIQAVLQNKQVLPTKHPVYTLPLTGSLVNSYTKEIHRSFTQGTIDAKLSNYISQASLEELQEIFTQFKSLKSSKDYQMFYKALDRNKNIHLYKKLQQYKNRTTPKKSKEKLERFSTSLEDFLKKRMYRLDKNQDEQNALIWFLSELYFVDYVQNVIETQTLTRTSKKTIAVLLQKFDIAIPYIFEISQEELLNLQVATFDRLYEKDSDRTLTLAFSIVENKDYRLNDQGYLHAMGFLTKQHVKTTPYTAVNRINKYFMETLQTPICCSNWSSFGSFYRVYAKPSDVKKLYKNLQIYLTNKLRNDNWEALEKGDLTNLLQSILSDMQNYDLNFSRALQIKLLHSELNKGSPRIVNKFLNLRDHEIANKTIEYLSDQYKQHGYVNADLFQKFSYVSDPETLKTFINMLNTFDDCMKIDNLAKSNLLRYLSVSEYTTLKCHEIPLGLVPSNKKAEYENLIQQK